MCNKSRSIFKDAFLIQLVAARPTPHPTLLLVLQEAPLAMPMKKHLEKEGWTLFDQFREPRSQWQLSWMIPRLPWLWGTEGSPEETKYVCRT